jgi:RimJ/RimL family protein N-acetyltransferase
MNADTGLWLERWDERGLQVERSANIPEMKIHLGGVEPDERLVRRHERCLRSEREGSGGMFLVLVPGEPDPVGSVGYWEREWRGEEIFEMGWQILPGFQGRGLASAATAAVLGRAAARGQCRWMHAFPNVTNAASNAVCARAGFESLGEVPFEFPRGNPMRCNDWRYDLKADPSWAGG